MKRDSSIDADGESRPPETLDFQKILDAAPDAVLVCDRRGRILYSNAQAESLFGYSCRELSGLVVEDLLPERFRSGHRHHRSSYGTRAKPRPMGSGLDLWARAKDGREIPVEVSLSPMRGGDDPLVTAAIRDVTVQKQALAQLEAARAFSERLIETAPTIVLLLDLEGRLLKINPYAEHLLGFRSSEIAEKSWLELFIPREDRACQRQLFEEILLEGLLHRYTQAVITSSGQRREIEWLARPLEGPAGEAIGLLNVGHDITEQLEAHRALEAARETAERASQANARFLAVASHDLRQPLQAAVNYLAVLDKKLRDPPMRNTLEKLDSSLTAVRELLSRLLDISKLEAGTVTPEKRPFKVSELFERLADEIGPSARERGLRLRVVPSSHTLYSDPLLLMEMMQNLLVNAVRYTREGGVLLGSRRSGNELRLQVVDTGIGIPQDRLDDIFLEFVQVGDQPRRRKPGLGLGLAIVKRLSELLDHPVKVTSLVGRGTTAEIRVPLASRVVALAPRETLESHAGGPSTIAVLDDDAAVLDSLAMLLETLGHDPAAGRTVAEVIETLGDRAPDLILCNFELERGASGFEAIDGLREACGIPDVPAVLLTGDSSNDRREEASQRGFLLLNKPVDTKLLARVVAASVSRRGSLRGDTDGLRTG